MFPFKKSNQSADHVHFGEKRVEIPRLSVGKWMKLIEQIEILPQTMANIIAARDTEMFWPSAIVGVLTASEEVITLVSVLADVTEDEVKEADLIQLHDFLKSTIERNNLDEAAKKYRAAIQSVLVRLQAAKNPN